MIPIRNANNKLVCQVDKKSKIVEIIIKGFKTVIRFTEDGEVEVKNTTISK